MNIETIRKHCQTHNLHAAEDLIFGTNHIYDPAQSNERRPSVVYTRLGAFQNRCLRLSNGQDDACMRGARAAHEVRQYIASNYL